MDHRHGIKYGVDQHTDVLLNIDGDILTQHLHRKLSQQMSMGTANFPPNIFGLQGPQVQVQSQPHSGLANGGGQHNNSLVPLNQHPHHFTRSRSATNLQAPPVGEYVKQPSPRYHRRTSKPRV